MKQIEWKQKALRQVRRIKTGQEQDAIYSSIDGLRNFPNCDNVKKLKKHRDVPTARRQLAGDFYGQATNRHNRRGEKT
jgi:hypothetical protein